uniref:Neural proliferation differentiation and control protein 1 n=1 Tax=Elaeophora elaphi TaxID=1147741 RepID=A0A0R3RTW3_9BILA
MGKNDTVIHFQKKSLIAFANFNIFWEFKPIKFEAIILKFIQLCSAYENEYNEPESNEIYDIAIENAENAAVEGTAGKLMAAQKKGQSEYVGFIEPKASNQMKHREILKKRVEDHQWVQQTNTKPMLHLAVATVCMLAVVIGVATGSYYFFKDRSEKSPADSCDFTYAPTGPGKSKKKKGGDEGLAYKAQLHHYQQAKQKIISGEDGAVTLPDAYESSESSDDENNFSVYECPGLAPTGDIEIQNPNFISQT